MTEVFDRLNYSTTYLRESLEYVGASRTKKAKRLKESIENQIHANLLTCEENKNYHLLAREDGCEFVLQFADQIAQKLVDTGEASDDYNNDYDDGDSWHHETYVDRSYRLLEAAKLLSDLSEFECDDSGLWEGQGPEEAIDTQAAFTYGYAVADYWQRIIKEINEKWETIFGGPDDEDVACEARRDRLIELENLPAMSRKQSAERHKLLLSAETDSESYRARIRLERADELVKAVVKGWA